MSQNLSAASTACTLCCLHSSDSETQEGSGLLYSTHRMVGFGLLQFSLTKAETRSSFLSSVWYELGKFGGLSLIVCHGGEIPLVKYYYFHKHLWSAAHMWNLGKIFFEIRTELSISFNDPFLRVLLGLPVWWNYINKSRTVIHHIFLILPMQYGLLDGLWNDSASCMVSGERIMNFGYTNSSP